MNAALVERVLLSPGTRLGPYAISAPLGAGGMGEVYQARDTRLDRTVAIKVLSEHLSRNEELRKRFEREARVISSLSHPNICTLYDVGHQDGTDFLVMEYLEGVTLAERLQKGALPTDQALRTAIEVGDALDRAHRAGVVHRDLKPGNIMLTKSGAKLLDFGLSRMDSAAESPSTDSALSASPTVSLALTGIGKVMGTVPYMAPEQVEGKAADARTDPFAFGAVLYEMVTGKRAFRGETQASVSGAILHSEPESLSVLQPMTPPALFRVVRRCLAKDPDDRWQTARDLTIELKWIAGGGDGTGVAGALPVMARKKRWRLVIGAAVVAAGAIAVTALITQQLTRPKSAAAPVVFSVPAPQANQWDLGFALSPDGRTLAFGDHDAAGYRIYLRPLGSQVAHVLEGTAHTYEEFWSPDSQYLGFFAENHLKKIKASGGRAETICEAVNGSGGTWNRDGVILFAPATDVPLYRVSAAGGQPTGVTTLDVTRHEIAHRFPFFLPDGRHFLYTVAPSHDGEFDCYVGSLDSPDRKLLLSASGAVVFAAPGYVIFRRNRSLIAQRFDPRRLQLEGEPTPIPQVVTGTYNGWGKPTAFASDNGVLAWLNSPTPDTEMVWLDRRGIRIGTVDAPPGRYEEVAVAPDNRRLAVTRMDATGNREIWIVDPTLGASRLTFDPDTDSGPIWSRDGRSIYFISWRSGVGAIYRKPADGSRPEELVYRPNAAWAAPASESPDGRILGFAAPSRGTGMGFAFWLVPLSGSRIPVPYLEVPTDQYFRISPDGHWSAYHSSESGTNEVYVQSFPTPGRKFQISTEGGYGPDWANGGREIQYGVADKIMSIDVQTNPTFQAGKPHVLWSGPKEWGTWNSPDGQRFIVTVPTGDAPASTYGFMVSWTAALK